MQHFTYINKMFESDYDSQTYWEIRNIPKKSVLIKCVVTQL